MPCGNGNGNCNAGIAPPQYLVTPEDAANSQPLLSGPVVDKRGRQTAANVYVYNPAPSGQIQTQSSKVGR